MWFAICQKQGGADYAARVQTAVLCECFVLL